MFVGPRTCDTFATLESRSGRTALAEVGEVKDPDEAKPTEPLLKGVVSRDWIESTRTCGVWMATGYCTPVFGSIQKFGAVCELDDSEMSRSLATSRIVSPTSCAALRSTSTSSSGVSVTWARCTSTAPGMVAIRDARSRATARFAVWFPAGPVRRTSMGAERPKLRICVEMSAARKKNVACGNAELRSRRNACTYWAVGPCLGVREINISPSALEIIDGSPSVRLIPLTGTPMLSE